MWYHVLLLFLPLGIPTSSGPLSEPHPDMSDQELFWGADQYDFSVVLSAGRTDCFWHFAHQGETFYLSYMVQWVTGVGHDRHLSVTVNAPSGLLLSSADEVKGQISVDATETGFHQMCLSNFHNIFGAMQVFISFGVYYDGDASGGRDDQRQKEDAIRRLNDTLSVIQDATQRVERQAFHMFRYYSLGRMRRSADSFLLHANSRFITWTSAALSLLVVVCGSLQLLCLKRLFASTGAAGGDKPRC